MYLKWLAAYLIIINLCGILSMYMDKRRARNHQWRIPEKTLFLIALLGGSAGSIIGMKMFRHKTKHWQFTTGMPAIFIMQTALFFFFLHFFHII
jgi:Predicted membrane protein